MTKRKKIISELKYCHSANDQLANIKLLDAKLLDSYKSFNGDYLKVHYYFIPRILPFSTY